MALESRPPRVAIVVLNWNGWRDTLRCLESLARLEYPCVEVLVVDNGSSDGSADMLRQQCPGVELLELDTNRGFAGGMNWGIRRALDRGADFVLLLNNDTLVAPDLLTRLVTVARTHPRAGLFGCELRFPAMPNQPAPVITGVDWLRGFVRMARLTPGDASPLPAEVVSGEAVLARREVVARVGPLDERYFLYFEDLDWALRARRAGFGCLIVPGAVVWHRAGASTRGEPLAPRPTFYYYHTRNNVLFVRAHGPRLARLTFIPFWLGRTAWTALRVLGGGLIARKANVRPRLHALAAGLVDGWLGRSGARCTFGGVSSHAHRA